MYQNLDNLMAPGYHSQGRTTDYYSANVGGTPQANTNIIEVTAGEKIYSGNAVFIKKNIVFDEVRIDIMPIIIPPDDTQYGVTIDDNNYFIWYNDTIGQYFITINEIDYIVYSEGGGDSPDYARWIMYPIENITFLCYNQIVSIQQGIDYYTTIGIALNDAEVNENVKVQYNGIVNYYDIMENFTGFEGNDTQLIVFDNITKNINNDVATAWNYDRFIIVGDIIFENKLLINIREHING